MADQSGVSMADFERAFVKQQLFTSGFGVHYSPSILTASDSSDSTNGNQSTKELDASGAVTKARGCQHLARKTILGQRFPSFKVVNHCDARSWQIARWLRAEGIFHIVLFAGDVSWPDQMKRVHTFANEMTKREHIVPLRGHSHRNDTGSNGTNGESCENRGDVARLLTIHL